MNKLYVIIISLLGTLVGMSAPFVVPLALLFTKRDAKNLAFAWYDTPDEPELIGLYEPTVQRIADKWGWFISAWYWFGLRNRAHGFDSAFSKEAPEHWPETGSHERGEFFLTRARWGYFVFTFGWPVYHTTKYPSGFEYRPQMSIKTRRLPTP